MPRPREGPAPIVLSGGRSVIVGYGSLLSRRSMELTLGRPYGGEILPCEVAGWRRSWDVMMPNTSFYEPGDRGDFSPAHIVYLNVRRAPDTVMNAVAYVVTRAELQLFDRREWIYDRVAITHDLRGIAVAGGEAYVYVAKPEWRVEPGTPRQRAAIRRTYLGIIEEGLREWGDRFRAQYASTTDPVPAHLVFDDRRRG